MDLKLGYFQPVARFASIYVEGEGGTTFGSTSTGIPQFFLGSPLRLSAYGQNEFHGNQYYLFRTGYLHDLLTLPPSAGKKVYAIGAYEFGKMYGATNASTFPNYAPAHLVPETSFGPFFIAGLASDIGHTQQFFSPGHTCWDWA